MLMLKVPDSSFRKELSGTLSKSTTGSLLNWRASPSRRRSKLHHRRRLRSEGKRGKELDSEAAASRAPEHEQKGTHPGGQVEGGTRDALPASGRARPAAERWTATAV